MSAIPPAERIAKAVREIVESAFKEPALPEDLLARVTAVVEKSLIVAVLTRYQGNQTHTADALGVNRATLYKKMKAHGLK